MTQDKKGGPIGTGAPPNPNPKFDRWGGAPGMVSYIRGDAEVWWCPLRERHFIVSDDGEFVDGDCICGYSRRQPGHIFICSLSRPPE